MGIKDTWEEVPPVRVTGPEGLVRELSSSLPQGLCVSWLYCGTFPSPKKPRLPDALNRAELRVKDAFLGPREEFQYGSVSRVLCPGYAMASGAATLLATQALCPVPPAASLQDKQPSGE